MKLSWSLFLAIPLASFAFAPDAAACGACFHGEMENSMVTGHRMIFSISQSETTLWDQLSYDGDPQSFAWVLPVKGTVEIGVSSDALFQNLNVSTQVTVEAPPISCPPPPPCWFGNSSSSGSGGVFDGGLGFDGGVTVVSQQVVGPYDTVVLHSSDPNALADWLTTNMYVVQSDFAPVVTAYINEGFDFLAIKLLNTAGVSAMKPIRVTTPGAGATLPLRMVAGGTGVTTPITLWVFGEGRYQPANFPWFVITEDQLVWDFANSSSNYKALKQAGYDATMGRGWLIETAAPFSQYSLSNSLQNLATVDPVGSGYGDDMGNGAVAALMADLGKLWGGIPATSLWLTRTHAELPRAALATDLSIGASATQAQVKGALQAKTGLNVPPCPAYTCEDAGAGGAGGEGGSGSGGTGKGGTGGLGGIGMLGGLGGTGGSASDSGGCNVGAGSAERSALGALGAALALALARRRRAKV